MVKVLLNVQGNVRYVGGASHFMEQTFFTILKKITSKLKTQE